ncbi:MAG: LPS export ABC transporter permease LptG [Pseudomonadota bacterium]
MFGRVTLPWYLAKRFLVSIFGVFALCCLLVFMIDFIEMLRQSGKYGGGVTLWGVVLLTLLRLPAYAELLLTFAVLVGTISTLLQLNRKSELAVMRAGGMSVWQFARPGVLVAFVLGLFSVTVYNPMAAYARAQSEALFAQYYGRESTFLGASGRRSWFRQDGRDGPSALHAAAITEGGLVLTGVTAFRFHKTGGFAERISGSAARLRNGYWNIENGWLTRPGHQPVQFQTYQLSTYLTPERVRDAVGTVISLSFWELPGLIEVAEKAGLSSNQYLVQYHLLLSRPFLLIAMVLLGTTVSLRSFRSGGIQSMILLGLGGAFGFFMMAEVSRQMGAAGVLAPWAAVWVPVGVALLLTSTVLLHQEDG